MGRAQLAQPIKTIARSNKVPPEDRKGIPLPVLPESPGKFLKCQMTYRRRVSSSSSESTSAATQTTRTPPRAKPTTVSPTVKSPPKKKTKLSTDTVDAMGTSSGFPRPNARGRSAEPVEEGERTLGQPMDLEEVKSPLVPQTFRVVEPVESHPGFVSNEVLGVSPVVAQLKFFREILHRTRCQQQFLVTDRL